MEILSQLLSSSLISVSPHGYFPLFENRKSSKFLEKGKVAVYLFCNSILDELLIRNKICSCSLLSAHFNKTLIRKDNHTRMINWCVFHLLETSSFVFFFFQRNEEFSLYFLEETCYLLAGFVVDELRQVWNLFTGGRSCLPGVASWSFDYS